MVHYKLYYLNFRGRGEVIRVLFAAAGEQYEDIRIERADWANYKSKSPTGKCPLLEVTDGDKIFSLVQSVSIARFLARRFNLAGKGDEEQAIVDMYADQTNDWFNDLVYANFIEKDEDRKKELAHKLMTETIPNTLGIFEKRLSQSTSGFLVNSGLSYADIFISCILEYLGEKKDTVLANFPHLKKMDDLVRGNPRIAEWLAKRPKTDI